VEGRIMIVPGDLVKHADWEFNPVNCKREGIGFVASYDKQKWYDSGKNHHQWVIVHWIPFAPSTSNAVYHVDSLVRVSHGD